MPDMPAAGLVISTVSGSDGTTATARQLSRFESMTVYVVDDNDANVVLLSTLLKRHGMQQVITETDSRRVAAALPDVNPDLVLLDLHMPHVGGLAVLEEIMRYAAGSYLPVMVLTADVTSGARNTALVQGARDFLTKPLDNVEVILRVANLLETRRLYSLLRAAPGGHPESGEGADSQSYHRIRKVLREGAVVPFYQPVVEITTGRTVGYEALARFSEPHPQGVAGWFSEAAAVGLGTELEWLAVVNALPFLDSAGSDIFLALNMSPASIALLGDRTLCRPEDCSRIVIELTEHMPIEDYSAIHRALQHIRDHGARLAADDLGSGYAGFRHLVALDPDIIKLDISLVRGIHRSRPQRALARALVAFASDVGAQVVAEGVEEAAELDVLLDLGVPWAQGYYLGMPKPAELVDAGGADR